MSSVLTAAGPVLALGLDLAGTGLAAPLKVSAGEHKLFAKGSLGMRFVEVPAFVSGQLFHSAGALK